MSDDLRPNAESRRFPTTAWPRIMAIQDHDHAEHVPMVNWFITAYWKPVFYFFRAKGQPREEAEDLTQSFFMRFLEKDWILAADQDRGRFRNFLLRIAQRYLSDQGPKRAPRQQRFEKQFVAITTLIRDEDRTYEPPSNLTPEVIYNRQCAFDLVQRVRMQLRELYVGERRQVWYDVFAAVHSLAPGQERPSQDALAARFGQTRDQVRYALEQAEKRFERLFRSEIRAQVGDEVDVDDEVRDVRSLLES